MKHSGILSVPCLIQLVQSIIHFIHVTHVIRSLACVKLGLLVIIFIYAVLLNHIRVNFSKIVVRICAVNVSIAAYHHNV